jgi:hypothetical protein
MLFFTSFLRLDFEAVVRAEPLRPKKREGAFVQMLCVRVGAGLGDEIVTGDDKGSDLSV